MNNAEIQQSRRNAINQHSLCKCAIKLSHSTYTVEGVRGAVGDEWDTPDGYRVRVVALREDKSELAVVGVAARYLCQ